MPIKHFGNGGLDITGDSITFAQLVAQRGAVYLEMQGIRMVRGPVLWKRLAKHYNIHPMTKQAVYNWLDAKVKALAPQQEHIDATEKVRS